MRNIVFIITLLLLFGCGGLKKQITKHEERFEQSQRENERLRKQIDSLALSYQEELSKVNREKTTSSWTYTAPPVMVGKTDTVSVREPLWMEVNGRQIDLNNLPAGSSLTTMNQYEQTTEYYKSIVVALTHKIEELKTELEKKADVIYVDRDVQKDVERQTAQWMLVCGAFVIGILIPDIVRWVKRRIKNKISPI